MEKKNERIRLEKVEIQNFKSLRNTKFELKNFNVLVGPNASGKTNIVELFNLLQNILNPEVINPFAGYGGYRNVVWQHNEELFVNLNLKFNNFSFELSFTGIGGEMNILSEKFSGYGWEAQLRGNKLYAKYGDLYSVEIDFGKEDSHTKSLVRTVTFYHSPFFNLSEKIERSIPRKTTISRKKRKEMLSKFEDFENALFSLPWFVSDTVVIRPIPKLAKMPSPATKAEKLKPTCENLHSVLYTIFTEKMGFPKSLVRYLRIMFPDIEKIAPTITEEGNVILKVVENGIEYRPQELSDGFYKVLSVLTALQLDSDLLVIDEIENSIHPETIEVLVDALKKSGKQIIITTHSPAVLDTVEPEDVVLVSKEGGETKLKRMREPDKLKKRLEELGMSLGESWLLGGVED